MQVRPVSRFTRFALAQMRSRGDPVMARQFAARWPHQPEIAEMIHRAAVDPGTTFDGSWAGPLAELNVISSEFVALLRPATILGQLVEARKVPLQTRFPAQTSGASVGWLGQGGPSFVSELSFNGMTLGLAKVGGIVVISDELARSSDPAAEPLIENDLIAAVALFTDQQLLDPNVAAVVDVSPASITNGAALIPSSGINATQVENDLKALVAVLTTAGVLFLAPYFIMTPRTALHLATLRTSGSRVFPDVSVKGGSIWGIPVLVSGNVPTTADSSALTSITLVDSAELLIGEGGIEAENSRDASVQMVTDPASGAQSLVSLWQNNLVGARVVRTLNFQMRRSGAVATLTGVTY